MTPVLQKSGFLNSQEVRRSLVHRIPKMSAGRKGLPGYAVSAMYEDYKLLKSCSRVARIYGRTRQSIFVLFKTHGLPLNPKRFQDRFVWGGLTFTPGKNGYLRCTDGERRPLHKLMWEKKHGPVPAGYQVTFRDGNKRNFAEDNLVCLPTREVTLFHYRRRYPERAAMTGEALREYWKAHYREYAARRSARFVAKGLRSDGKPRALDGGFGRFNYFPPVHKLRSRPAGKLRHVSQASLSAAERLALI